MKTPITYYGGKQRLADTIIAMIPAHKIYCEPFFGGGAVFFSKPKSYLEVINDIDNRLIDFYLAVQNNFEQLEEKISQTLNCEAMYMHAKDIWNERVETTLVQRAWAVWLITNGSFAGSMQGGWKWSNGTSGSHTGVFMNNKRKDFNQELHLRIETTQISCRDAMKVIQERDSAETFFYLDPPYPGSYQGHYSGYSHKDLYELLQVLSSIKGKFILSNYWSQTLRFHIHKFGWHYDSIEIALRVANLGITGRKTRTEILIYNFDPVRDLFS